MGQPRSVLLIGGTCGMGMAAALRFAARGARLLLVARSHEALSNAARRGAAAGADPVETVAADVAAWPEVEATPARVGTGRRPQPGARPRLPAARAAVRPPSPAAVPAAGHHRRADRGEHRRRARATSGE